MKKYKIGYTTGVFDLFHVGHLNLLQKAKEQCEFLIVGVSTDELVSSYKHKHPVIRFEERIRIVEAIKYVDLAVPQKTIDKIYAWEQYRFNAVFHGDDWKGSDLYKKQEEDLRSVGCDLVFLPHTDGISSTIISQSLSERK